MSDEQRLLEKLKLIEALFAGAATPGEREAAALARDRVRKRLEETKESDPPVEYSFTVQDTWSGKLLIALLRRYGFRPYRYPRQRRTTIMSRVPARFVNETLWPEFLNLNKTLKNFLSEVTDRVISEGITTDTSDAEVRPAPASLPAPAAQLATPGFPTH